VKDVMLMEVGQTLQHLLCVVDEDSFGERAILFKEVGNRTT
jgi:hypothetical protein